MTVDEAIIILTGNYSGDDEYYKMNYVLLIIPITILAMFARIMFINRYKPKIEIEIIEKESVIYDESDFYDDNFD